MSRAWSVVIVAVGACSYRPIRDDTGDAPTASRCDAPSGFAAQLAPSTTLVVGTPSGTPDGSVLHPYGSLAAALAVAPPGTRISLAAGSHAPEQLDGVHGTAAAPYWIEGPTSGSRATFTGQLRFGGAQYVVLRHVDIVSSSALPLTIDDVTGSSHHIDLDDLHVSGPAGVNCVVIAGVDDVSAQRIATAGCVSGLRLIGSHRVMIARAQISTPSLAGVTISGGSTEIDIRQSVISQPGMRAIWIGGLSDETEFRPPLAPSGNAEASRVRILDNIIDGTSNDVFPCSLCRDVIIAGNLVRGSWMRIGRLIDEHGPISGHTFVQSGGIQWSSNAIDASGMAFVADGNTDGASVTFSHDLWNGTTQMPATEPGAVVGMPSGYDAAGTLCNGAAAHAGIAIPELPGTLAGDCRPDPPSIGPSEPGPGC